MQKQKSSVRKIQRRAFNEMVTALKQELRAAREQRGLSIDEVSRLSDISRRKIINLENPKHKLGCSIKTILKIALALSLTLEIKTKSFGA